MQTQIIEFLKSSEAYISGEEISQSLKISRSAIWKYMQELRHLGYDIVAVPHLGYKLISSPDKLFPHEIQHALATKIFGKKIIYEDTVSSTMDVAFRLALEKTAEGTVVCAESQTKGRGRLGRSWTSVKGKGIYMSIVLRPKLSPLEVAKLTLLGAVVVSEALKKSTGLQPLIKWPNDLLVKGRKLAGILTEMSADTDRVKFIVIGIGLNVNSSLNSLPPGSTSLKEETKEEHSRIKILQEILREMERWYLGIEEKGFKDVIQRWKELSVTLDQWVRVADAGGFVEGLAVDLDRDGGLLIRKDSGVVVKKMAGDVIPA